jgi:hypothetical protein
MAHQYFKRHGRSHEDHPATKHRRHSHGRDGPRSDHADEGFPGLYGRQRAPLPRPRRLSSANPHQQHRQRSAQPMSVQAPSLPCKEPAIVQQGAFRRLSQRSWRARESRAKTQMRRSASEKPTFLVPFVGQLAMAPPCRAPCTSARTNLDSCDAGHRGTRRHDRLTATSRALRIERQTAAHLRHRH